MRPPTVIAKTLLILVLLILATSIVAVQLYRKASQKRVEFTLPAGIRGPFIIIEDPLGEHLTMRNGAYEIAVPPSRITRVKSLALFQDWLQYVVKDAAGQAYPFDYDGGTDPNQIALHSRGIIRQNDLAAAHFWIGPMPSAEDDKKFDELRSSLSQNESVPDLHK